MKSPQYLSLGLAMALFAGPLGTGCGRKDDAQSANAPTPSADESKAPAPIVTEVDAASEAPHMSLALDELPTSIGDDKLEEEGILKIDEYKSEQDAHLKEQVDSFLLSCDALYRGPLTTKAYERCYANSARTLVVDKDGKEIRSENLDEHVRALGRLKSSHPYREVFDPEPDIWLYQFRIESPWFFAFYTSHQIFDGGMYAVDKVAVVKREAGGFRIYRDRMLSQEYDLTKSPPRNFVEYAEANDKIGHVVYVSLKEKGSLYEYEIHCEYLEGTEERKGTLSKDGWTLSSYTKFDYCVDSGYDTDLCYDRKLEQTFDPKTRKLTSVKGHYIDTRRASGKKVAEFKIRDEKGLEKAIKYAQENVSDEQLKSLFESQVPKELLKPVEWTD